MTIKLINILPTSIISSREIVKELIKNLKKRKNKEFILDFTKIEFISRSAAHELLKAKEKIDMEFINMTKEVAEIVRVVAANRAYPQKNKTSFKPETTTLSSLLAH